MITEIAYLAGIGANAFAQHAVGDYKADIAKMNAQIAGEQTDVAMRRGAQQEQQLHRDYGQLLSKQRAYMAAQGLDLEEDTALNIQMDTTRQEEIDILTLRNNVAMEAWGYQVQAYNYTENAKIAKQTGNMGAFTTVLTGAADYAFATGMFNSKAKPHFGKG